MNGRGQRGVSLAEFLVAITVLALAGTVAMVLYDGARASFKIGGNLTEQQQVVRIAFDEVTKDLRLAGFNTNPDGDKSRPDEQIEAAHPAAIVIRADFDASDPLTSIEPEESLGDTSSGADFDTVSTGNDEIVAYVLANDSSNETLTFEADVTPDVRDGQVDRVDIPGVSLNQDDPPYTLFRITLDDDATPVRTPMIDNVRYLRFTYYDFAGNLVVPPSGFDDPAGVNRASRAEIRRIGVDLQGLTRDADVRWSDPDDPVPGPGGRGQYRKFDLEGDVTPRNLGRFGVRDLATTITTPSTPPAPSLFNGHCNGLWVSWLPNPPEERIARYELRYGTDPDNLVGPLYPVDSEFYLDGLTDQTQIYVTVEAVDDTGNVSLRSPVASETTENENTPGEPADLAATQDRTAEVSLSWDGVAENDGPEPTQDPISPRMRDLQGYEIHRNRVAGFEPAPATQIAEVSQPTYSDTDVVNCRDYYYRVRAVDHCGDVGVAADAVLGKTTYFVNPLAPLNVQASWITVGASVQIEWDPVTQDVAGNTIRVDDYRVHRASGPEGAPPESLSFSYVGSSSGGLTSYIDDTASGIPDTYYYRVTAHDDCVNESVPSEAAPVGCNFDGDVVLLQPLNGFVFDSTYTHVGFLVDVSGSGGDYTTMTLRIYDGVAMIGEHVELTPPHPPGPTWYWDWPVSGTPGGVFSVQVTIEQLDGCTESTSIWIEKN